MSPSKGGVLSLEVVETGRQAGMTAGNCDALLHTYTLNQPWSSTLCLGSLDYHR